MLNDCEVYVVSENKLDSYVGGNTNDTEAALTNPCMAGMIIFEMGRSRLLYVRALHASYTLT